MKHKRDRESEKNINVNAKKLEHCDSMSTYDWMTGMKACVVHSEAV